MRPSRELVNNATSNIYYTARFISIRKMYSSLSAACAWILLYCAFEKRAPFLGCAVYNFVKRTKPK
jgi:hypothetical protein